MLKNTRFELLSVLFAGILLLTRRGGGGGGGGSAKGGSAQGVGEQ